MAGDLAILMYHSVSSIPGRLREFGVPPSLLREHLSALRDAGYDLVGQSEALDRQSTGRPGRTVALTFDDGYADFLTHALEILSDLHARATLYPAAGHLGQRQAPWLGRQAHHFGRLLTGSELREIAQAGVEIGNHGLIHQPLDVLPSERMAREIRDSQDRLSDLLGQPTRSFCYPHGYHDHRVRAAVAQAGHDNACAVGHRRCGLEHDRLAVPRLAVTCDHRGVDVLRMADRDPSVSETLASSLLRPLRPPWRVVREVAARGFGIRLT